MISPPRQHKYVRVLRVFAALVPMKKDQVQAHIVDSSMDQYMLHSCCVIAALLLLKYSARRGGVNSFALVQ